MYISFYKNKESIASSTTPTYINSTSTITELPTMSLTNAFAGMLRIRQGGMIRQDQQDLQIHAFLAILANLLFLVS